MELVAPEPKLDMYDETWPIWTYQEQTAPAKFVFDEENRRGCVIDSIVAGGCIVSGASVKRSLLFPKVRVNSYCNIEDSVIFPGVNIGRGCTVKKAIIDTSTNIPPGLDIGVDYDADRVNGFRVTEKGIVLVTRDMIAALENKK